MVEVRILRPSDDRSAFRSGDGDLDSFFHRFAGQNQFRHHLGTSYVAVDEGRLLGFVTVAAADIEIEHLPARRRKGLPGYPLPVLRIARLAVDQAAQKQGIGKALLRFVFLLAQEVAGKVGCIGVVVDAKEPAREYYASLGFEPLHVVEGALGSRPEPMPMFIPLGSIPKT